MTGIGWLDPETYVTRNSFDVALAAVGAAIAAVGHSLDGRNCFALVRPPGHHAEHDRARGFCLLNNAAIAAAEALDHVDRVLVVDWDVHHGNGTQHAFYGSDRVLYCSVHQEHHFPFSGYPGETGTGKGVGYTINAPLSAGSGIADYFSVFNEIFVPAIERFRPEVTIVSAGQDLLYDDPLGGMAIRPQDLSLLTRLIHEAAGIPLSLVLEGGYGVSHGEAVAQIFSGLGPARNFVEPSEPQKSTRNLVTLLKKVYRIS
jgi:acetoin utilization deacetylase AcuC-like enzyme